MRRSPVNQALEAEIRQAALDSGLQPELIASVLADEHARLDLFDFLQNRLMRLGLGLPRPVSAVFLRLLERVCRRSVDSFSLGLAQMKSSTLAQLGRLGYLEVPTTQKEQLRTLLDPALAPGLVAACLQATADHWAMHGVPLHHRPDILGTLYSLGLTGSRGVHAWPEASARGEQIARHAAWLTANGHL